jgi:hypothetical protein
MDKLILWYVKLYSLRQLKKKKVYGTHWEEPELTGRADTSTRAVRPRNLEQWEHAKVLEPLKGAPDGQI